MKVAAAQDEIASTNASLRKQIDILQSKVRTLTDELGVMTKRRMKEHEHAVHKVIRQWSMRLLTGRSTHGVRRERRRKP